MYPVVVRGRDNSTVVVHLSGEIDALSCDEIESSILAAVSLWDRIVVDAADVTFCCSTGLSVFIRCHEAAAARGAHFELVNTSPQLERIVAVTGLEYLLASESTAAFASGT